MKVFSFIICFLLGFSFFSAQNFNINGSIESKDQKIPQNVTVYLQKQKDSSIINYSSASAQGNFSLKINAQSEPAILRVEADKYKPFSKIFEKIDAHISLGKIFLEKVFSTYWLQKGAINNFVTSPHLLLLRCRRRF